MSLSPATSESTQAITLPDIPILAVNTAQAVILTSDGELQTLPHEQARLLVHKKPVMVCHAPYTRHRLGADDLFAFDLLELFAFVHPAQFAVPTPVGLAKALGLSAPSDFEDYPFTLMEAAQALLSDLSKEIRPTESNGIKKADVLEIAHTMGLNGKGWPWAPFACRALGHDYDAQMPIMAKPAMNIWKHLPEWADRAPEPPPAHDPVSAKEAQERLEQMLGVGDKKAELREQQREYTGQMAKAFAPMEEEGRPHVVLAEAGTGVGKTLGYLSPATVWAEKNDGTVWISTYTKNLQRQIDGELDRLYPHPEVKKAKVTVRKGRENYLCLLNLEDVVAGAALAKHINQVIAAGIMVRWAEATKDGDLQGGDFPGWLPGLLGWQYTRGLSDTRGECIYSACDHYHRCFVEKTIRKAQHSDIVVANHALVMIKAAIASDDDPLPPRLVFDEGHHLFDAADSAFAGHLTAREAHDLRRWIRGAEGGKQSRARGLKRRAEDLIEGDNEALADLDAILHESMNLPAFGWSRRMKDKSPQGVTEKFLILVYQQVFARADGKNSPYSLETQTHPLIEELPAAAAALCGKLRDIQNPMRSLCARLRKKLHEQAETLDSDTRKRLESVAASLERRSEHNLSGWIKMLETLQDDDTDPQSGFVDWMAIERVDGKSVDIGLYRHWIDPMVPFAKSVQPYAQGIGITSATLRDATEDDGENWRVARERTGVNFLSPEPYEFAVKSPFNYTEKTRIIVVNDINKNDLGQLASAYRALFKASGGGALGLFTAIQRLKGVYDRISHDLEHEGLPLYAQHVDDIDTGTLVDMFREDTHACLFGTDAVRDGVDVPGDSLRLLVYDRVPWPRPDILHKARREAFGKRRYDELITRLKLRQAYGRLIRSASDKGVFVMLDSGLPTRLCGAFPEEVPVERVGLAEAVEITKEFCN
ncbi:MAG TPA: ATP-dependent DNA helicase [Micavibrio sp.]|nr:ATP-dependent DNA helicase [Micavibrio sp.]